MVHAYRKRAVEGVCYRKIEAWRMYAYRKKEKDDVLVHKFAGNEDNRATGVDLILV